jgi:hypothetical protein
MRCTVPGLTPNLAAAFWKWQDRQFLENHPMIRAGGLRGPEVTIAFNCQIQVVPLEYEVWQQVSRCVRLRFPTPSITRRSVGSRHGTLPR